MPTFHHTTEAQFRSALRERFRTAKGVQAANIAEYLLTLTVAQLQALFALPSQTATTSLRTRLTQKVSRRNAIMSEVGE